MYLVTIFEVIGWWGAVAKMLESGEERDATMTINEAICSRPFEQKYFLEWA
jgi:hypothetical protein